MFHIFSLQVLLPFVPQHFLQVLTAQEPVPIKISTGPFFFLYQYHLRYSELPVPYPLIPYFPARFCVASQP